MKVVENQHVLRNTSGLCSGLLGLSKPAANASIAANPEPPYPDALVELLKFLACINPTRTAVSPLTHFPDADMRRSVGSVIRNAAPCIEGITWNPKPELGLALGLGLRV